MFYVKPGCEHLLNANNIFPLKQKSILKIVNSIKDYVNKVYIFGSSTNWNCNYDSDIDLVVYTRHNTDINKIHKIIAEQNIGSFDLLTGDDLDKANDTFLKKFEKDKVLVYESLLNDEK